MTANFVRSHPTGTPRHRMCREVAVEWIEASDFDPTVTSLPSLPQTSAGQPDQLLPI